MMPARHVQGGVRRRLIGPVAMIVSIALLGAACSNESGQTGETSQSTSASEDPVTAAQARVSAAQAGVSTAETALTSAHQDFCGAAKGYVETLDRYGRVFTDRSATVGDVQTLGADLVEPRAEVTTSVDAVQTAKTFLAAAQQELVDAEAALAVAVAAASSVSVSPTTSTSVATTTLVPAATIERVQLAEDDLARTAKGINADTPLIEAGAAYNSAALALEIAWLHLLVEADCVSDQRLADAVAQLTAYTTALQTDLTRAGYDPGPIDGVYGPQTVAAVEKLQTDSGLPVTGFVDEATARALQNKLAAVGQQQATQSATQTAALQTALKLAGFWDGPIDGIWTDALTQALKDLQTKLGVAPTGQVDPATVAAFQQALAALPATVTSEATATAVETTTATATATKTAVATQTATTTEKATKTATVTTTAEPPTTESTESTETTG